FASVPDSSGNQFSAVVPAARASTRRVPRDFAVVAGRNNGTAARAVLDVPLGAVPDLVVRARRQRAVLGRRVWRLQRTRHRFAFGLRGLARVPVLEIIIPVSGVLRCCSLSMNRKVGQASRLPQDGKVESGLYSRWRARRAGGTPALPWKQTTKVPM